MKHTILAIALSAVALGAGAQYPAPLPAESGCTASGDAAAVGRARAYMNLPLTQGALDAAGAVVYTSPVFAEQAQWLEAEALFQSARFAEAADAYRSFAVAHPSSVLYCPAQLRIAECMMSREQYAAAGEILAGIDPSTLPPMQAAHYSYDMGVVEMQLGRSANAQRCFRQVDEAAGHASWYGADGLVAAAKFYQGVYCYNRGEYTEAAAYFNQAGGSGPLSLRRDIYLAGIELARDNNGQAASLAARALAATGLSDSERAAAEHIAGEALWRLGRTDEAVPFLRRHISHATEPAPAALYLLGVDAYRHNDLTAATEYLSPASEAGGDIGPRAALVLGQALYGLNRGDAAAAAFRRAATEGDADDDLRRQAYYNYAVARFGGANVPFESASATFEDFLRRYPTGLYTDRVRQYLAQGYLEGEDYDLALERLDAIANPGPQATAAKRYVLYALGNRALNTGNASEAMTYLNRAAAIGGDRALTDEITLAQGRALLQQGSYAEARAKLNAYLGRRDAPNAATAQYYMGYALFGERQYPGADRAFHSAENSQAFTGKALADILNRRADIAYYGSDFASAADLYGRALDADRASGDYAAFQQARMYAFGRDYRAAAGALSAFRRAYPSSTLMPDALLETAAVQVASGHSDDAVATYNDLIAAYPLTAQGRQAYIQKAMTLLENGRREPAVEAYKEVVRRYPSSEEAVQASNLLRAILADQGRGAEYVAFINSVDGAPAVDRAEAAQLEFGSATLALENSGDTSGLIRFIENYPDAAETEEATALLAEADYAADRTEMALLRWQELEPRASTPAMAMRARMGILRSARDLGRTELAGQTAGAILESSAAPGADLTEATYSRALYLSGDSATAAEAIRLWTSVADRTDELYGAKSAYEAAEALYQGGNAAEALEMARSLSSSRSPHKYWIARAFILQADILQSQGKNAEAREYLRALLNNYPGNEPDIPVMVQERLDAMETNN